MKNEKFHHPNFQFEEMNATMLINDVGRLFHDEMRKASEEIGLKSGYRQLLFHLFHEDNITQLDLVRKTHLKAPTISVTLGKMELEGLITKNADPADARQTRILLTEKGRAFDERLRDSIAQKDKEFLACLSQEEQMKLRQLLWKVRNRALAKKDESEKW